MKDSYEREIDYMRISVTDRCNLRCKYCMPHDISLLPHEEILRYEEIIKICGAAALSGIRHLKVTGGEPLVRKGCVSLIGELKKIPGIEHVTLTTNGVLLKDALPGLLEAGIDGINVSLDTLDRARYREITGKDRLPGVREGILQAVSMGIKVKINCVPVKGYNDEDIWPLAVLAKDYPVDVRFIEMMPIGYGKEFGTVEGGEILNRLCGIWPGLKKSSKKRGFGPAVYYTEPSFRGSIGFIEAMNHKFCSRCNRVRLTADGYLKTCLYYKNGIQLKKAVREGASREDLCRLFCKALAEKPREHHFGEMAAGTEDKKMSQIGG